MDSIKFQLIDVKNQLYKTQFFFLVYFYLYREDSFKRAIPTLKAPTSETLRVTPSAMSSAARQTTVQHENCTTCIVKRTNIPLRMF